MLGHFAPGVHILAARCIGFETCAPGVCMLFGTFEQVYIERHMNKWLGAPFFRSLHPAGAQNKTLISNIVVKYGL